MNKYQYNGFYNDIRINIMAIKRNNSTLSIAPEALFSLQRLGEKIRANRIANDWTIKDTASKLFCSQTTYKAIESGKPSVSVGLLFNVLWLLGQIESVEALAPIPTSINNTIRVRKSKNKPSTKISEVEREF